MKPSTSPVDPVPATLLRPARPGDTPALVGLIRELAAFERLEHLVRVTPEQLATHLFGARPAAEAVVAEAAGRLVGMLQMTYIPGLSRGGSWRALVEAVRIASTQRGQGAGRLLMQHAIARARARGCRLIQLTTDKQRQDAHRFYARLGFVASHEGMKLPLVGEPD